MLAAREVLNCHAHHAIQMLINLADLRLQLLPKDFLFAIGWSWALSKGGREQYNETQQMHREGSHNGRDSNRRSSYSSHTAGELPTRALIA